MTNADRLRAIMRKHKLTRREIAGIVDDSVHAVHAWLRPKDNAAYRPMPDNKLELLQLKLKR